MATVACFLVMATVLASTIGVSAVQNRAPETYAQSCKRMQTNYGFVKPPGGCDSDDCLIYDGTSKADCQFVAYAAANQSWTSQGDFKQDSQTLGGKIYAYRLQWSSGNWSEWYAPGINDLEIVSDTNANYVVRRLWSRFHDLVHAYIICR